MVSLGVSSVFGSKVVAPCCVWELSKAQRSTHCVRTRSNLATCPLARKLSIGRRQTNRKFQWTSARSSYSDGSENSGVNDGNSSGVETVDPPLQPAAKPEQSVPAVKMSYTTNPSAGKTPVRTATGKFRAGQRRAEVRLPGLLLRVTLAEIFGEGWGNTSSIIDSAVAGGVTMVVLVESENIGGGALYEAACSLRTLLRGRAQLLVANRADIAAVAGADGVLLSDEGLPAVVARRMMQDVGSATAAVLPLIARSIKSPENAAAAAVGEGADLLIIEGLPTADIPALISAVRSRVTIPVIVESEAPELSEDGSIGITGGSIQSGADGIVLGVPALRAAPLADARSYIAMLQIGIIQAMRQRSSGETSTSGSEAERSVESQEGGVASIPAAVAARLTALPSKSKGWAKKRRLDGENEILDAQAKVIIEEERALLSSMLDLLHEAVPEMAEISLLEDALAQLDDPFLLVIVGEFNSGKSSFINALLGKKYLKEGVVPTTNEITLLKHSGDESVGGVERSERHPDGHVLRYLPASLLAQMNLVDTPGTNVILQRQQRLTEEFVPRADLVLFVLSADRPLTESEVSFLRYIKQWGKKVIFILNKSDVLTEPSEVEEVLAFVQSNAQSLLGVEDARVYPVSARRAFRAKQAATSSDGHVDRERLAVDELWHRSGFEDLETFIVDFLGGATNTGAERIRLKLDTPLGVGAALMSECERQLEVESTRAMSDVAALASVAEQLEQYGITTDKDALELRDRVRDLVEVAKERGEQFVDTALRVSNLQMLAQYLLGTDGQSSSLPVLNSFQREVIGSTASDVQRALIEYETWISSNTARQLKSCRDFVKARWPTLTSELEEARMTSDDEEDKGEDSQLEGSPLSSMRKGAAVATLDEFDTNAAAILLEEEFRQVVMNTALGVGAAGVSASLLTSVLPTTAEDLLALGLCSAGGYVGILNLPVKREEIKSKIRRTADSLARQLDAAMKAEVTESIENAKLSLDLFLAPYRRSTQGEVKRVEQLQHRFAELDAQLHSLRQSVQRVGS